MGSTARRMTKHNTRRSWQGPTPGPWIWDKHGDLHGKDGNAVINPNLRGDVLSGVNREADARLIAAAPDLLAALEAIVNDDGFPDQFAYRAEAIARAAIAKAKGEA